jgi:hypothetical protein
MEVTMAMEGRATFGREQIRPQHFALVLGIIYTLVGIAGFVPGVLQTPPPGAPPVRVDQNYGYLFGLFPVNILHTLVHLIVGVWGLLASRRFAPSRTYAQSLAVIFGVLTIMGLVPGLNTVFGLIPLFAHDIWLHALTALVAAYFGWSRMAAREVFSEERRRAA